jgi:hypothetical protein
LGQPQLLCRFSLHEAPAKLRPSGKSENLTLGG